MYNLSLLRDDVLLINKNGKLATVKEFREVLIEKKDVEREDDYFTKHDIDRNKWYIAEKETWSIDSHRMLMRYLEEASPREDVPGWFSEVRDLFSYQDELFKELDEKLNNILSEEKKLTEFYIRGKEVIIDL